MWQSPPALVSALVSVGQNQTHDLVKSLKKNVNVRRYYLTGNVVLELQMKNLLMIIKKPTNFC